MHFTYRYTYLDSTGRIKTDSEKIDADAWLDYLKANGERYGNLNDYISAAFATISAENPLVAAAIAGQIDETFHAAEPTAVFQYLMYCWVAFKAGKIPSTAWAAALGSAWLSGQRSLLDGVALAESLVIRMFREADKETLYQAATGRKGLDTYLAELPEEITAYRGISTASKFQQNGFSWTTDPEQAKKFSAKQVSTASQIPGVIRARIPKAAILAVFDEAREIVVDPTFEKAEINTSFLNGPGLTKFRQNWKKWQTEEAKKMREARKGVGS